MRKFITFLIIMALSVNTKAQKLKEYTAANGVTYKVNDSLTLNKGSGQNGDFLYFQLPGWGLIHGNTLVNRLYNDLSFKINAIVKQKWVGGVEKVNFVVSAKKAGSYWVLIEDAISVCEILPCNEKKNVEDNNSIEKLIKLKKLLDEGAINKDEYEAEKKKVLK